MTDRIYSVDLNGLEAHVTITPTMQGARAYTLVFDENADIVVESNGYHYIDYCDREIVWAEAGETLTTRRQIEYADISDALDALGLTCNCDN